MDEKDYESLARAGRDAQHHPRRGQTVHDPVGAVQAHQGAGTGAGGGDRPALTAGHPLHAGRRTGAAHSAAAAREMEKMRRQLASIQGEACGTLRAGISVNFSYTVCPRC